MRNRAERALVPAIGKQGSQIIVKSYGHRQGKKRHRQAGRDRGRRIGASELEEALLLSCL